MELDLLEANCFGGPYYWDLDFWLSAPILFYDMFVVFAECIWKLLQLSELWGDYLTVIGVGSVVLLMGRN